MNIILLFLVLLLSSSAFAQRSVSLSPIRIEISAENVLSKFEEAVLNPEDVLRRYRPSGFKVTNKRVARNEISFTATKTVLFVTKSLYVHGLLDSSETRSGCSRGEKGYNLNMRFDSSDHLVTDNVDELQALVCLSEESDSKISGQIHSQIILGSKYSKPLGPFAVSLIKDQVSPLISALTEEIKSMR